MRSSTSRQAASCSRVWVCWQYTMCSRTALFCSSCCSRPVTSCAKNSVRATSLLGSDYPVVFKYQKLSVQTICALVCSPSRVVCAIASRHVEAQGQLHQWLQDKCLCASALHTDSITSFQHFMSSVQAEQLLFLVQLCAQHAYMSPTDAA